MDWRVRWCVGVGRMDGWADGRTEERKDGGMDGLVMDGWKDRRMYTCTKYGSTDEWNMVSGWIYGWMERSLDREGQTGFKDRSTTILKMNS